MIGKVLKKGDTIGIVAPANNMKNGDINVSKKNLEKLGYNVVLGPCTVKKWHSFAGTDEERAKEINTFFADKSIDAIICMRGGYGSNRILELIDFDIIKKNPKIFVGYSDITSLHLAFYKKTGLKSFHGPMLTTEFGENSNDLSINSLLSTLSTTGKNQIISQGEFNFQSMYDGITEGEIVGGNLTTLISILGSEFDVDYNGKILFLEDIDESTYRIDRFLNCLKKHKVFDKINGLILGNFKNCNKASVEYDMSLEEVFKDYFSEFNKPILANFQSGHCSPLITLPLGVKCRLNTFDKTIEFIEDYLK